MLCLYNASFYAYASNLIYPADIDRDAILSALTGYTDAEWRVCDELSKREPGDKRICNVSKHLLYNDFLIGLLDANVSEEAGEYYEKLRLEFAKLAERESAFAYLFQSYAALCQVLKRKATYGKRLHAAYQAKDKAAMEEMKGELPAIRSDLQEFGRKYRTQWLKENKGFGLEVIDARLGALINRTETVAYVLDEYLKGRMEKIYELEDERLNFFCGEPQQVFYNEWATTYTVNVV